VLRRLVRDAVVTLALLAAAAVFAAAPADTPPLVQRFLEIDGPAPAQFRALRHLDAENDHFDSRAWMDVWTEADDQGGFRYEIVSRGGSEYICKRVFVGALDAEKSMWHQGADGSSFTISNYAFEDRGTQADGLASIVLKPRRKDVMLVEGAIFLRPEDADLVRVEGRLAKTPSFWTRRVDIVQRFQRFGGVRMPVAMESVASVRIAGRSTFHMTYEYESINGQQVGTPRLRTAAR
jgi:hypothetical protein